MQRDIILVHSNFGKRGQLFATIWGEAAMVSGQAECIANPPPLEGE